NNFKSAIRACDSAVSNALGDISRYFSSSRTASAARPFVSAQFARLYVAEALVTSVGLSSASALHKLDLCPACPFAATSGGRFVLRVTDDCPALASGAAVSAVAKGCSSLPSSSSDASTPMLSERRLTRRIRSLSLSLTDAPLSPVVKNVKSCESFCFCFGSAVPALALRRYSTALSRSPS